MSETKQRLTYDDALNMAYYKMTTYTGWIGGMRFKLGKHELPLPEDAEEGTKPELEFLASVWPGPYNSEITPDEKKEFSHFPFDEEGRKAAVDWINDQYEAGKNDRWPRRKVDITNM